MPVFDPPDQDRTLVALPVAAGGQNKVPLTPEK